MPATKKTTTKTPKAKAVTKKAGPQTKEVKKKAPKAPLSSVKKKIEVRQVKISKHSEGINGGNAPSVVVAHETGVKNILPIRKLGAQVADGSHPVDFRDKLEANLESKAEVRHFELNDKIDFKKLHTKSYHIYRKLAFSFLIFTSLLLVAVLYLYYVKVDIRIVLNKQQVNGNAVVNITSDSFSSSTSSNLPGVVREIDLSQSKVFRASGKEVLGSDVTGRVKITNNYTRNQPLVASTRLLSADGQMVRVRETVNVPAGGSIETEVFSTEATSSVNIPEGAKLTIPGLWQGIQDKIYAESITAITYQEKVKTVISEADLEAAKSAMKQELETRAKTEVLDAYKSQYSEVLYRIDDNSFVSRIDAKAGEAKDAFTVEVGAKVVVVAFSDEAAKKQAADQLMAQLPGDKGLSEFNQGSVTYELGNVDLPNGLATVNVGYAGTVINKNQNIIDRSKIVGLNAMQLESFIRDLRDENNNPLIDSYTITFTPSFIGRVPNWPDRINITPINK